MFRSLHLRTGFQSTFQYFKTNFVNHSSFFERNIMKLPEAERFLRDL